MIKNSLRSKTFVYWKLSQTNDTVRPTQRYDRASLILIAGTFKQNSLIQILKDSLEGWVHSWNRNSKTQGQ
jgi:hypothetical protein